MSAAIRRVAGAPTPPVRPFPWRLIWAMSPFVEMFREMLEIRYLWRAPIGLDGGKLKAFLGDVPATPLDGAVRASLADMDASRSMNRAGPWLWRRRRRFISWRI